MLDLSKTLTSLEVAEMVDKRHDHVLRDIDRIKSQMGNPRNGESYFIKSMYMSTQNKEMPSYLLTKKGCELYATRMTGEKGTQFAVAYIEKFNEMEQRIKEQPEKLTSLEVALQAAMEHEKEIKTIKSDVHMLKNTMRIDTREESIIRQKANAAVVHALGGKKSDAYRTMNRKVFSRFWREFKEYFSVARYGDIPKKQFSEALEWISEWRPDTSTRLEIRASNLLTNY